MLNIEPYLDIPYVWNGRGFDGCDCYGLVILYFKVELGIEIIDYDHGRLSDSEFTNSEYLIEHAHEQWIQIPFEQAQPNDCVLICNRSEYPNHCGIIVPERRFLHTLHNQGCATSKLSTWRRRVHGIYRHKELT